jgi:hypothetical protein
MLRILLFASPLLAFLLLLTFTACGNERDASATAPDDFAAFYERFHRDSLYQIEHINFPLEGLPGNAAEADASFRWERESWRMHKPIDPEESGFHSEFSRLGDIVIERIVHESGEYGMMRRFARLNDGEWYLIYYVGLNPLSRPG